MAGSLDLDTLKDEIRRGLIDTVLVCFPDMQGRLMGKRVTGHFFLDSVVEETHACDYLLAADIEMEPVPGFKLASWDLGYGDFVLKPDLATLRRTPWLEGTALVLADVCDHDGALLPHAPRSILKKQLARLAERGWTAMMASELEFYVINESYAAAREKDYKNLKHAGWYIQDYHIFQTTKEESLIRAIRNHMDAADIPVEVSKGEWGPGQEEINFRYAEALTMADRHVIYKNGAKEIAFLQDKAITFMAKPYFELAGNSCHIHASLWEAATSTPLFHDGADAHGMSPLFKHFLAGMIALARDMTYFLAPYINSYKRFQAGSFAPTKAAWSLDNRTAGFRIVGHGAGTRVECRIAGADCNPYLAYAALIAAGLHGIDNELELAPPYEGNVYEAKRVPDVAKTLREAIDGLRRSKVLRAAFGDEVIDHYVHLANWEQGEYDRRVTDWEVIHGFERA
ncbi:MAG: glutamine synthetase [Alphaproteobacteria bacterium]|nr:MAG: glutamine synthetase [Alphaproteobacteria bacterium]